MTIEQLADRVERAGQEAAAATAPLADLTGLTLRDGLRHADRALDALVALQRDLRPELWRHRRDPVTTAFLTRVLAATEDHVATLRAQRNQVATHLR